MVCESRAERDALHAAGNREGLGFSIMYPAAVHRIAELEGTVGNAECPHAEQLAERLLTVPVHPLVTPRDSARIAQLIAGRADAGVRR